MSVRPTRRSAVRALACRFSSFSSIVIADPLLCSLGWAYSNTLHLAEAASSSAAAIEMAGNRSRSRDVFIWNLNDTGDRVPLGGLILTPSVTNTDFRQMLDILLITSEDCVVQNRHGNEVLRDAQPLLPGDYTVTANKVEVSLSPTYLLNSFWF